MRRSRFDATAIVGVLFLSSFFLAGCLGIWDEPSIPAPEPGFFYDYGNVSFQHLGEGKILDYTGKGIDVQVVRMEQRQTSDDRSMTDFYRDIDLFLTLDLRHVIAYRWDCREDFPDGSFSCDTDHAAFVWFPRPTPWLFGASELWEASSDWGATTEVGTQAIWDLSEQEGRVLATPGEQPQVNSFAPEQFFYRGDLVFDPSKAAPTEVHVEAPDGDFDFQLKGIESRPLLERTTKFNRTPLSAELVTPEKNPGHLPQEKSDDWIFFPLTEAIEELVREIDVPIQDLYLWTAFATCCSGSWVGLPGGVPILSDLDRISDAMRWQVVVGNEEIGLERYEIRKEVRHLEGDTYYDVTFEGPVDNVLEDYNTPNKSIILDEGASFAEGLYPDDALMGVSIRGWYAGSPSSLSDYAYTYLFRPHWIDEYGTTAYSPYVVQLEAETGHLLYATNTQDRLSDLFLIEVPELQR